MQRHWALSQHNSIVSFLELQAMTNAGTHIYLDQDGPLGQVLVQAGGEVDMVASHAVKSHTANVTEPALHRCSMKQMHHIWHPGHTSLGHTADGVPLDCTDVVSFQLQPRLGAGSNNPGNVITAVSSPSAKRRQIHERGERHKSLRRYRIILSLMSEKLAQSPLQTFILLLLLLQLVLPAVSCTFARSPCIHPSSST